MDKSFGSEAENFPLRKKPKLREEIDSWSTFAETLRLEDRAVFKDMMQKSWEYSDAVEICNGEYSTEALLLSVLIHHQKMINWIMNQIESQKK